MATENLLKECLGAVRTRIESEVPKIYQESRDEIIAIVEEEIRNHFPVGNLPAFPVQDFDESEFYNKKSGEPFVPVVINDQTGWDGEL